MLKLGILLTAATVTILVVEFFRARRRAFPAHGWLGLAALASAEFLMFHGVEPAATYFSPVAWTAYILIADAATFAISGVSRLREEPRGLLKMAALSIPLWLVFEAYNLRLANWAYVGLPQGHIERWIGYAWAFATITPGIFMTAWFIEALGWFEGDSRPIRAGRAAGKIFIGLGAVLLIVPLVAPKRECLVFIRPGLAGIFIFARAGQRTPQTAFVQGRFCARLPGAAVLISRGGVGVRVAVGILELLGARGVDVHVPHRAAMEDLSDARAGVSCISRFTR